MGRFKSFCCRFARLKYRYIATIVATYISASGMQGRKRLLAACRDVFLTRA